uniref:Prealbumin-like fold domain-containing protein n=1 Tax=Pavo cristatus TaxID=9049 RepID=A0A8C9EMS7_PAVCR
RHGARRIVGGGGMWAWVAVLGCALCCALVRGSEDIVVGCGGFVKSDVEINYSLIEIKLYTKHGTLKYQTDCAPNNGYFMIPLYDKGDFILKIEPPLGWSFEPTSVDIHVDGINDICTKGGDINFVFTGFSVNGKVLSKGQSLGPAGVQVVLRNAGSDVNLQATITQPGGKFAFFKVLPGEYEIFASHPTWMLKESSTVVRVTSSNAYAASPLVVAGYNVSGSVRSDGEPMKGVMFLLFSSSVTKEVMVFQNLFSTSMEISVFLYLFICFHFVTRPLLQHLLKTKADGSFRLENITTGTYTIHARKEHLFFDTITVKIAPNTPQLADIIATGFSVCGQISVTRLPDAVKQINKYKVTMVPQDKDKASTATTETDPHGAFCFKAKSGAYSVKVIIPEAETRAGLALKPKVFPVTVTDRPVMDVTFSQFLASVSGKISCLDACGDLVVMLQSVSRQGEKRNLQLSGSTDSVAFTFENVLPGKYKVSIVHEDWCWKNKSLEVEIMEEDVSGVEFRQTGYMLRCSLSHAITLEFYQDGNGPENVGVYNLSKGVNRFCLSKPGNSSKSYLKKEKEPFNQRYCGGVFRSNLLTQDNGMLTFSNLSPGQYYFKPMMKEFRFEPSSQMIEVQEGQNLKIRITGYRTAYSCYGTVSSLNGEPEQGVSVEAVGQEGCSIYGEDTVTDEEGKFRLRGLLPGCVYHIQLKAEGNDHIERALPQHRAIEVGNSDIDDVNIIAFRQINQFDLSGNVITSSEYLSTLCVKLYKSENLDNPIHTVNLGQSLFFHFPPLLRDGENYVVLLDSTLSKSQYDYILPQVSFTSIGYHKHITLVFSPTRKLPEQDIAQGSYIALPLTLLLLLAGYNHDKCFSLPFKTPTLLQRSSTEGFC